MGAITGTLVKNTEFSGEYKLVVLSCIPASASDTVTLTAATHGITEILDVMVQLKAGYDAALQTIWATFSGLVITVVTETSAGGAATDWTGATARIWVIGR
jgi:hypothetical protein